MSGGEAYTYYSLLWVLPVFLLYVFCWKSECHCDDEPFGVACAQMIPVMGQVILFMFLIFQRKRFKWDKYGAPNGDKYYHGDYGLTPRAYHCVVFLRDSGIYFLPLACLLGVFAL